MGAKVESNGGQGESARGSAMLPKQSSFLVEDGPGSNLPKNLDQPFTLPSDLDPWVYREPCSGEDQNSQRIQDSLNNTGSMCNKIQKEV
jgi:hypothetical protein